MDGILKYYEQIKKTKIIEMIKLIFLQKSQHSIHKTHMNTNNTICIRETTFHEEWSIWYDCMHLNHEAKINQEPHGTVKTHTHNYIHSDVKIKCWWHEHTCISATKRKNQFNPKYRTINLIGEQPGYHFSEQREGLKAYVFLKVHQ